MIVRAKVGVGVALFTLGLAVACGTGTETLDFPASNAGGAADGASGGTGGGAPPAGGTRSDEPGGRDGGAGAAPSMSNGGETDPGSAGTSTGGATAGSSGEPGVDPAPREYPDDEFTYEPPPPADPTPEDACALGSTEAVPTPLDIFVLLDRSGSMNLPQDMPTISTPGGGDCNVGEATVSRWCYSLNALDGFFGSVTAAGTGVALQFFPAGDCSGSPSPFGGYVCCSAGSCCRGAAEATPAVPLQTLPDARAALVTALNAQVPAADRTPIEAALRALIEHTSSARRPERQIMGLLITDGGPEGCTSSAANLAKLVLNHRQLTGIPIYVVGTNGAAFSWLETIAAAGGAPEHDTHCAGGIQPCHFYNVGSGQPEVFIQVLQQIRRAAVACRFDMPQGDGLIDNDQIALSLTPTGEQQGVRVSRLLSQSECSSTRGFYYDDNQNPRQILLCPTTCDEFRDGDGGSVEVLLGCRAS